MCFLAHKRAPSECEKDRDPAGLAKRLDFALRPRIQGWLPGRLWREKYTCSTFCGRIFAWTDSKGKPKSYGENHDES